jgi:DNA-binding NtrC family response regulator
LVLASSTEQPESRVRRILIVEDDAMVSEIIGVMLEDAFDTIVAGSVPEALTHLASAPALILLDCLLPGGGLLPLLREADRLDIPVVLISGDPTQAALVDPSRPFLPKPFSQAKLLQVIDAACGSA